MVNVKCNEIGPSKIITYIKDTNPKNHNPSFTWFSQKAADIFDLENSYFSCLRVTNGMVDCSWKLQKIVGTGFCEVIFGELPVQNSIRANECFVQP